MVSIGEVFPEFDLFDQRGRAWSKKDLLGSRCVVFCYPKDSTSG